MYTATFIFGFVALPAVPLMLDYSIELVYPIGESIGTGLLISSG